MSNSEMSPIVVVGGGTSGLAFVAEFVKHSDHPVMICEPGLIVDENSSRRFFNVLSDENIWPDVRAVLTEGVTPTHYLQARAFGGGSAVNGMLNLMGDAAEMVSSQYEVPVSGIGPVAQALVHAGGMVAPLSWRNDRRLSDVSEVAKLIDGGRVQIVCGSVTSLVHNGETVTSVVVQEKAIACTHVVLASGVLQTTSLLKNCDLFSDVQGIGQHVTDHPCVTFSTSVSSQAKSDSFDASVVYPFTVSVGNKKYRSVIIGYERASANQPEIALLSVCLLTTESQGWIDFSESQPIPHLNMLSIESEKVAMRAAVRELCAVARSPELQGIGNGWCAGETTTDVIGAMSDEELDAWIQTNLSPVSHISGGCAGLALEKYGVSVIGASSFHQVPDVLPNRVARESGRKVAQVLGGVFP